MTKAIFTPAIDCTNEQRPDVQLSPIQSNKLHQVGYCPDRQLFAVQFSVGGAIYVYPNFSPEQHDAFQAAESKGRHFGQHIQCLPSKKYSADPVTEDKTDGRAGELNTEDQDHGDDEAAPTAAELEAAGQARLIA